MPVTFASNELLGSVLVKGPNPSYDVSYEGRGSTDRLEIESEARIQLPSTYDSMPLQEVSVEEFGANDEWKVQLLYAPDGYTPGSITIPETGTSSFSFDTGGGTQHITTSLETVHSESTLTGVTPVFDGAIGVTENGVEGVDITVPVFQFKETHYIAASLVTTAYKKGLATLTGRTNNAIFQDFAIGEVLFLGASGTYRANQDDWEITYNFAQANNRTGIELGDIVPFDKNGWDYLWIRYKDEVSESGKSMVKTIEAVYVERVYEEGDFSGLNPS